MQVLTDFTILFPMQFNCCLESPPTKNATEAKRKSYLIDQELAIEKRRISKDVKSLVRVLLLGPRDSGKSTVLKQFRLLNNKAFTEQELQKYTRVIHWNLLSILVQLMTPVLLKNENKRFLSESQENEWKELLYFHSNWSDKTMRIPSNIFEIIQEAWKHPEVQTSFLIQQAVSLPAAANYAADYKATDDDVLYARLPTTQVTYTDIRSNNFNLRFYDVGGQLSLRHYWAQYFTDISAIIYILDASCFNQTMPEETSINRLKDAIRLFESVAGNSLFDHKPFIIFLNKTDLLQRKLGQGTIAFREHFYDYKGHNDYKSIIKYLKKELKRVDKMPKRMHYVFETFATDANTMRNILMATNDLLIREALWSKE